MVEYLSTFISLFILLAKFSISIEESIGKNLFDYTIIVLSILGFYFIYNRAMKAIQDLNKINL